MLLYVEEIRALQVRISLRLPGANGSCVDGRPNFGFGDVIFIMFQDAGDRSEFSQHIRDHHVLDLELGRGVNATAQLMIERTGSGDTRLAKSGARCGPHPHAGFETVTLLMRWQLLVRGRRSDYVDGPHSRQRRCDRARREPSERAPGYYWRGNLDGTRSRRLAPYTARPQHPRTLLR